MGIRSSGILWILLPTYQCLLPNHIYCQITTKIGGWSCDIAQNITWVNNTWIQNYLWYNSHFHSQEDPYPFCHALVPVLLTDRLSMSLIISFRQGGCSLSIRSRQWGSSCPAIPRLPVWVCVGRSSHQSIILGHLSIASISMAWSVRWYTDRPKEHFL